MIRKYYCEECGIRSRVHVSSPNAVLACLKIQADHEEKSPSCGAGKLRLECEEMEHVSIDQ